MLSITLLLAACAARTEPQPVPSAVSTATPLAPATATDTQPEATAPGTLETTVCEEPLRFDDEHVERAVRGALGGLTGPLEASAVSSLERLHVSFDTAREASLAGVECLASLTVLALDWREHESFRSARGQHVTRQLTNDVAVDLVPLEGLTALQELRVIGGRARNVDRIRRLGRLRVLELTRTTIGRPALRQMSHGENDLGGSVELLAGLTGLTELRLRHCGLVRLDGIAGLGALRELDLTNNDIRDLEPLRRLTQLERLALSENWSIADLTPLLSLPALERLEAYHVATDCARFEPVLLQLRSKGVAVATTCP